ncbi:MAG TPA: hypothetical protein VGR37_01755 [Longimicrobiaceae bacterium]|nr:hypothetical protein [Longimicrobiaceae bacterium]
MHRLPKTLMMGVTLALTAAACETEGPLDRTAAFWFRATVTGTVQADYHGGGDFQVGADSRLGGALAFALFSASEEAGARQSFSLQRVGSTLPARGIYPITLKDGFTAQYLREVDRTLQAFVARSGELEITHSSAERVEGRFRLVGFQYCARDLKGGRVPEGPCRIPEAIIPDAPIIEISGSFRAGPASSQEFPR